MAEFVTRLVPHLERLRNMDVQFREMRPDDLLPVAP